MITILSIVKGRKYPTASPKALTDILPRVKSIKILQVDFIKEPTKLILIKDTIKSLNETEEVVFKKLTF